MAMTKKEQAAMKAAIERAEMLGALRWTSPVERDVGEPPQGYSEGWDYNVHSQRVWQGWSNRVAHGEGKPPENGRHLIGSQGSRRMFSTKAMALAALRHDTEKLYAEALARIDRQIAAEREGGE